MAKKGTSSSKSTNKSTSTPVRRTSTPRVSAVAPVAAAAPVKPIVTDADIAKRAYELFCAGAPGGQLDHWLQAERELRGA